MADIHYSDDLKWRMVWQVERGNSVSQTAENLLVDESTVSRVNIIHRATDAVGCPLTVSAKSFIGSLILEEPGISLKKIQTELLEKLSVEVTVSTLRQLLSTTSNFRQQAISIQRNYSLRQTYISDVSLYSADMFLFVDEMVADIRPLDGPEERISAVAIMSTEGILDVHMTQAPIINSDDFYHFIMRDLLPHLNPFDGVASQSVLVMDNCPIHHSRDVQEFLKLTGTMVHFLPPSSMDLNPLELAFSKVKNVIKIRDPQLFMEGFDARLIMLAAFASITQEDCQDWILLSGVY